MYAQALAYWPSIIAIFVIAMFVLLRNRRPAFLLYGAFSLSLALFFVCQYFVDLNNQDSIIWVQFSFLVSEVLCALFLAFVHSYPDKEAPTLKNWVVYLLPLLMLGPLSFTPLLVHHVSEGVNGLIVVPGLLYAFQTLTVLGYLLSGIVVLIIRFRNSSSIERQRVYYLLAAFCVPLVALGLTGTVFINHEELQFLRPLSALVMIGIITYAMIFRKLFDIRGFVVRAVGYVLTFSLLGVSYAFVLSFIGARLLNMETTGIGIVFNTLITIVVALAFNPLKKFFDKLTSSVFYQDAYDPQELLDTLNHTVISHTDLEELLYSVSQIIQARMKVSYCTFALEGTAYYEERILDDHHGNYCSEIVGQIKTALKNVEGSVFDVEVQSEDNARLFKVMHSHSAAVIARLNTDFSRAENGMGLMILGAKKSGNLFNKQDMKLLRIIANELSIAVQNSLQYEEIERFNETLQRKVDEATLKLKKTNEKLKQMDETKDEFISMASHQLRTPLTSVKGYVSMVLEEDAGPINDMQRKLLDQAFVSSQRMVFLIADLLNVSRLRTGKFVIEAAPTNLAEVVQGEVNQLKETALGRGLTLEYEMPTAFPVLMLDETKIRQVVMNFMDNAIYYTPNGGHISVHLKETEKSIEFTVRDNGIGVPKHEQLHLFNKFYRAGNARKARPDGTGLGLFMAKKVVMAQGGAIIFRSHEGKGSTFGFTFAKAKLAPPLVK